MQILVHGTDANRARIIQGYAQGAVGQWAARRAAEGKAVVAPGRCWYASRLWFNEANNSRYFLVPGLIVLIMTLIGAFLTALVMAREWERGTLEALFVTPVRADEILLGKIIPYFALGMVGLALCLLAAQVPVPRAVAWLAVGADRRVDALPAGGAGHRPADLVGGQEPVPGQPGRAAGHVLPALMLSGFLFDLRSMPAAVRLITYALPARYYVTLLQTIFLAGDVWGVILPNAAVLAAWRPCCCS